MTTMAEIPLDPVTHLLGVIGLAIYAYAASIGFWARAALRHQEEMA